MCSHLPSAVLFDRPFGAGAGRPSCAARREDEVLTVFTWLRRVVFGAGGPPRREPSTGPGTKGPRVDAGREARGARLDSSGDGDAALPRTPGLPASNRQPADAGRRRVAFATEYYDGRAVGVMELPLPDVTRGVSASGSPTRDLRNEWSHVRLDLEPQVLSLAIPQETTYRESEERLAPTCPVTNFVSASMLAVKAKIFDDGLYAAAEIASQPRKAELLSALADIAAPIAAAARLGRMRVPLSPAAEQLVRTFLGDELASKPLGFYTWSDPLRRIFQQDRLLQQRLEPRDAHALSAALHADASLSAAYADHLDLVSKLTNPFVAAMRDLRQPDGCCFFPPSHAHETDLVKRLFRGTAIPDGFSLADEMVRRLRDGSLHLEPTDASGWYDLQTWALEGLVLLDRMPEGPRVRTNDRYRRQLEDLFKAILSLTRETHVKQLEVPLTGASTTRAQPAVVWVWPGLTLEPLRTYYERRARGYEFVRDGLQRLAPPGPMHRVTPDGAAARTLDEELVEMVGLFRGAAAVAGEELGMTPASDAEADRFREWAASPDVTEDIRMMVPVFYDLGRRKAKVWAVLGWARRRLTASFATPPVAHVLAGEVEVKFRPWDYSLAYPVFAETYVSRLLDRDEFRALCDRYQTQSQILEALVREG